MITIIILKISRIKIHDVNGYSLNVEVGYTGPTSRDRTFLKRTNTSGDIVL